MLVGRTPRPGERGRLRRSATPWSTRWAMLGVPLVLDVEIGHVPPHLPLVNGALARVVVDGDRREITQELR